MLLALSAAFAADLVPEQFATLQEAIDHGTDPVIRLAPGHHAGAVVTRPVTITGKGAVIDRGVDLGGKRRAGIVIPAAGTGTTVQELVFGCTTTSLDLGVFASAKRNGSVGDEVTVTGNRFLGCVQAVTNSGNPAPSCASSEVDGGRYWTVTENVIDGLATTFDNGGKGGGIGVLVYNASGADVSANTFTGRVQDRPDFATTGVALAGCIDCIVAENTFSIEDGRFWYTAVSNAGARLPGAVASRDLLLTLNDAWDDSSPWLGVSFVSRDSDLVQADENLGAIYVDHERCGDGALYSAE